MTTIISARALARMRAKFPGLLDSASRGEPVTVVIGSAWLEPDEHAMRMLPGERVINAGPIDPAFATLLEQANAEPNPVVELPDIPPKS